MVYGYVKLVKSDTDSVTFERSRICPYVAIYFSSSFRFSISVRRLEITFEHKFINNVLCVYFYAEHDNRHKIIVYMYTRAASLIKELFRTHSLSNYPISKFIRCFIEERSLEQQLIFSKHCFNLLYKLHA